MLFTSFSSATLKVVKKLTIATPSAELIDAYLSEIAKAYGVSWAPARPPPASQDSGADGGVMVSSEIII